MKSNEHPSICIPKTSCNIDSKSFKNYFEQLLGQGCIERVDLVKKTNFHGVKYQCVFIHMYEWPDNEQSQEIRKRLLEGMEVKVVYDDPWFLNCYASRVCKPEQKRILPRSNPSIVIWKK